LVIFLPQFSAYIAMPITCGVPLRKLSREEFGELSYEVMRDVFDIHNELGRFFEEHIYKRALAVRRSDVALEVPIEVSLRSFTKCYFVDVLVAGGGLFEFKAVQAFVPRHEAQLLHYLLLTGLSHAMLVNVRSEKVTRKFVNSSLTRDDRFNFALALDGWSDHVPGASELRNVLLELLADWGTGLELSLYTEALTHFLGGASNLLLPVMVRFDGGPLGEQIFHHAAEHVAFKLTAFEATDAIECFAPQAQRLLAHTDLAALLWVNIARHRVTFNSLCRK
jgi:GxxExxY protein